LALPHVAFHAAGVLDFVLTAVPRMHALSGAPGGVFLLSTDAQVAPLLAPVAAAECSAEAAAAAAAAVHHPQHRHRRRRSTFRRVDVHDRFLEFLIIKDGVEPLCEPEPVETATIQLDSYKLL
jgi:hypothetical protein